MSIKDFLYNYYLQFWYVPKAKKIVKKLSDDKRLNSEYEKELNFLRNKIDYIPYNTDDIPQITVSYDNECQLYYAESSWWTDDKLYLRSGVNKKAGYKQIMSLCKEQSKNSPHRYVNDSDFQFEEGDILIDCGCAEGNFSLMNAKKAKHIYLIESDSEWNKSLEKSFAPYKNKVTIINSLISDKDGNEYSTLDTLFNSVKNEKIFIKMDLEGWGGAALQGAKQLMSDNKCKIASACYHSADEYDNMITFFKECFPRYKTSSTDGFMFMYFFHNFSVPYFVKGMIRASFDNE